MTTETQTCIECGNRLGASYADYDDFGCVCLDCDRKNDPAFADVPYIAETYYCGVCHMNAVDVGNGRDTCEECLARQ